MGASERPSRSSLETRKAEPGSHTTARDALRSLHAAERKLLHASQRADLERALAACATRLALASAAKAQAITADSAARIAALDATLTLEQREAAVQRIKAEETAALAGLYLAAARDAEHERRVVADTIEVEHRRATAILSHRQRIERIVMAVKSRPSRLSRRIAGRVWSATRSLLRRFAVPRSQ